MTLPIVYPEAVFGYSAGFWYEAYPYVSAETSTTISAGMVVSINTAGKILKATTSVDAIACIGIAWPNDIEAGGEGLVVVRGHVTAAIAQGTITAPTMVGRSGTTAGSVAAVAADATTVVGDTLGFAVADAASSACHVFVHRM